MLYKMYKNYLMNVKNTMHEFISKKKRRTIRFLISVNKENVIICSFTMEMVYVP